MRSKTKRNGRTPGPDLTCREIVELVTGYVEGTLPGAQRGPFERHITLCPDCDTYLDLSEANQRVLLHRGRARLRQVLEDAFEDGSHPA